MKLAMLQDWYLMIYEIKDGMLTIDSEHLKTDGIKVEESKEDGRIIYSAVVQD